MVDCVDAVGDERRRVGRDGRGGSAHWSWGERDAGRCGYRGAADGAGDGGCTGCCRRCEGRCVGAVVVVGDGADRADRGVKGDSPADAARLLPLASLAWTVIVDCVEPLATSVVGLAVMVVVAALTGPGVSAMVGEVVVIALPPMVPVMVAVPVTFPAVRVAV